MFNLADDTQQSFKFWCHAVLENVFSMCAEGTVEVVIHGS
jgi:hypothetical protein